MAPPSLVGVGRFPDQALTKLTRGVELPLPPPSYGLRGEIGKRGGLQNRFPGRIVGSTPTGATPTESQIT